MTYSISELAEISGISTHTLRVWEKRHALLQPTRTTSNARVYSPNDLKTALTAAMLCQKGYRISVIAKMTGTEREETLHQMPLDAGDDNQVIDMLSVALAEFQTGKVACLLDAQFRKHGVEETMINLVAPMRTTIAFLRLSDSLNKGHEQCFHHLVYLKLCAAIDALPRPKREAARCLIISMRDINPDLLALSLKYALRRRGCDTIWAGAHLSGNECVAMWKAVMPSSLWLSVEEHDDSSARDLTGELLSQGIHPIMVSGNTLNLADNPSIVELPDLVTALAYMDSNRETIG